MNIISDGRLSLFIAVAFVVMVSPGPAVVLAITNGVLHGIKNACFAILGNMSGFLILSAASILGLGLIVSKWPGVFGVIRWCGGLYLVYLGYRMWNTQRDRVGVGEEMQKVAALSQLQMYRRGMAVTLSNPKAIIFVAALFPQFINVDEAVLPQYIVLSSSMIFLQGLVLSGYAILGNRARTLLNSHGNLSKVYKASGVIFALFGISLLVAL